MNQTIENIKKRKSVRRYNSKKVESSLLEAVIDAATYAPSASNEQSWYFTVIQDQDLLKEMNDVIKENAKECGIEKVEKMVANDKFNVFYGASTLILVSYKEDSMRGQTDIALASQNLMLAAQSLDLATCWNEFSNFLFLGDAGNQYKMRLGIPEGYRPSHGIVIGHTDLEAGKRAKRKENTYNLI